MKNAPLENLQEFIRVNFDEILRDLVDIKRSEQQRFDDHAVFNRRLSNIERNIETILHRMKDIERYKGQVEIMVVENNHILKRMNRLIDEEQALEDAALQHKESAEYLSRMRASDVESEQEEHLKKVINYVDDESSTNK